LVRPNSEGDPCLLRNHLLFTVKSSKHAIAFNVDRKSSSNGAVNRDFNGLPDA
jgi:hypothetical protein